MNNDQDYEALQPQAKKQRVEEPIAEQLSLAATSTEDADDFYGVTNSAAPLHQTTSQEILPRNEHLDSVQPIPQNSIPGLILLKDASQSLTQHINGTIKASQINDDEQPMAESKAYDQSALSDPVKFEQKLSIEPEVNGLDQNNGGSTAVTKTFDNEAVSKEDSSSSQIEAMGDINKNDCADAQIPHKEVNDNDEYEFTSSSGSSDTSSSESDSSDDDGEEYPLMTAEEQVKILMREEVGEDNDTSKCKIVRTEHEIVDEQVKKPEVVVTENMKIVQLGIVETIVGNMILIKANKPGDFQVLETGSVLCLENRSVIGAVSETLGRVQEPLYSVAFSRIAEIGEAGINIGTIIYYVEDHSTYVFTQPLKSTKGTDASNQHDEEPNPEEMEFSDDEAEAEYKRNFKRDRKLKRGQKPTVVHRENGFATNAGPINYDDGDLDDGLYEPLARPANLHELMQSGRAPLEESRQRRPNERRRGGARSRPNRGNFNQGRNVQRISGEDNPRPFSNQQDHKAAFNNSISNNTPYSPEEPLLNNRTLPQRAELDKNVTEHRSPTNIPTTPSFYPTQTMTSHAAMNHNANWLPVAPPPMSPNTGLPPGAHVNPAFFANYQASQGTWQQTYQQQPMWSPPLMNFQQATPWYPAQHLQSVSTHASQPSEGRHVSPESDLAFRAAQERLDILRKLSGGGNATSP